MNRKEKVKEEEAKGDKERKKRGDQIGRGKKNNKMTQHGGQTGNLPQWISKIKYKLNNQEIYAKYR
jgi:hypothetical protein